MTKGLTYDLIKKASGGDVVSIEKILSLYDPYINTISTVIRQIPKLSILIVRDITKANEKSVTQRTIYGLIFWKRLYLAKSDV